MSYKKSGVYPVYDELFSVFPVYDQLLKSGVFPVYYELSGVLYIMSY